MGMFRISENTRLLIRPDPLLHAKQNGGTYCTENAVQSRISLE